jgi:hypothetical protein
MGLRKSCFLTAHGVFLYNVVLTPASAGEGSGVDYPEAHCSVTPIPVSLEVNPSQ